MGLASVGFGSTSRTDLSTMQSIKKAKGGMLKSMERLSSGFRINSASDDAAALAIAEQMRAELAALDAASRNVDYGTSLGQVADAAMSSQGDMAIRMRELAMQSANGTLNDSDRAALQNEFNQLRSEMDRVASTTQFNGQDVLQGGSVDMQVGTGGSAADRITVEFADTTAATLGLGGLDISAQAGAQAALDAMDSAISSIAAERGSMGASLNRLTSARDNLGAAVQSTASSLSRIVDTDYAEESAGFAQKSRMLQAGIGVLASSNKSKGLLVNLIG